MLDKLVVNRGLFFKQSAVHFGNKLGCRPRILELRGLDDNLFHHPQPWFGEHSLDLQSFRFQNGLVNYLEKEPQLSRAERSRQRQLRSECAVQAIPGGRVFVGGASSLTVQNLKKLEIRVVLNFHELNRDALLGFDGGYMGCRFDDRFKSSIFPVLTRSIGFLRQFEEDGQGHVGFFCQAGRSRSAIIMAALTVITARTGFSLYGFLSDSPETQGVREILALEKSSFEIVFELLGYFRKNQENPLSGEGRPPHTGFLPTSTFVFELICLDAYLRGTLPQEFETIKSEMRTHIKSVRFQAPYDDIEGYYEGGLMFLKKMSLETVTNGCQSVWG